MGANCGRGVVLGCTVHAFLLRPASLPGACVCIGVPGTRDSEANETGAVPSSEMTFWLEGGVKAGDEQRQTRHLIRHVFRECLTGAHVVLYTVGGILHTRSNKV